ncbi:MAG: ferredoxin [Pseudomonadota bacterium]
MNTPNNETPQTPVEGLPPTGIALNAGKGEKYESGKVAEVIAPADGSNGVPRMLTVSQEIGAAEQRMLLEELHRFHASSPEQGMAKIAQDLVPALLSPFRELEKVRHGFPLFLYAPGTGPDELLCVALSDLLAELVESFAPSEDQARILRDNLPRIELFAYKALSGQSAPVDARNLLSQVAQAVQKELQLREEDAARLKTDFGTLLDRIPTDGKLLGFNDDAILHLLFLTARHVLPLKRAAFKKQVDHLRWKLKSLLLVEKNKDTSSRQPEALRASLEKVSGGFVDPTALANILGPARGSVLMTPLRRKRIEAVKHILDEYVKTKESSLLTIIHEGELKDTLAKDPSVDCFKQSDPCKAAASFFDKQAAKMADVFRAVRIAYLEVENAYDSKHHDAWLERFDWEAFSEQEALLVPPVVVLQSANRLGEQLVSLSRLLLSGLPVKVVVTVQPAGQPGETSSKDPAGAFHFELGYLGLSQREAIVQQSSLARPAHLVQGLMQGFTAARASLHVVSSGVPLDKSQPNFGGWLYSSAALEGRAHPFFLYNPAKGTSWAQRFDLSENPQPEQDWPVYALPCKNDKGEEKKLVMPFTFAEFALLEPAYRGHFAAVAPGCPDDDLIAVDEYLALDPNQSTHKIPFVWAVDKDHQMLRLAITRRLAFACRDRLGYWRTLQELGGVNNEYVRKATDKVREEARAEVNAEKARLEATRAEEIERARTEAAGESMGRLAAMLLESDLTTLSAGGAKRAAAPSLSSPSADAKKEATVEAPGPVEEKEEDLSFNEPWIDTPLCTSCNDCINLNPQLFLYNGNKQALLGDLNSGTYAQIVAAAQKCPSRAIHPGKPWNPDEPNLEELTKKAEPFS